LHTLTTLAAHSETLAYLTLAVAFCGLSTAPCAYLAQVLQEKKDIKLCCKKFAGLQAQNLQHRHKIGFRDEWPMAQ
jgi:uncharacterized metal-binding protein